MTIPTGLPQFVAIKQHKTNLNHLMKLETLAPSRRQLAQYTAMWLDAKTERDRNLIEMILINVWGRGGSSKWKELDDPADPTGATRIEREADAALQSAWDEILEGRRADATTVQNNKE